MDDVIIGGAGPVGLLLACELGLRGCSVLVLEREADVPSPWRTAPMGMRGLNTASVETFDRRGLLEAILAASGAGPVPDDGAEPARPRGAGHFAGIMLDGAAIRDEALAHRLPSPALEWVMTNLHAVETVLRARAVELGARIEYDAGVTTVGQDDEGVVVTAGGREHRAGWLVGCDGGRSTVRHLAGFDFVGTDPQFTGYVLHADVDGLEGLRPGFNLTPHGMYLRMPTDGHLGLMDFDDGAFDRSRTPTREHLEEVLRRISGADVRIRAVHLASSFTDRAMQASTYRRGRVLLAGDAAHIHSPLGGQGLNSGIGDATDLGWKLAATVHGTAPAELLDTYEAERHPVAERVLDWSRAQVSLMRPGPQAQALQGVVRDLLATPDGTTYVFRQTSGASVRYDLGDDHSLVGEAAPAFRLLDGTRLADLLAEGRGVLLDVGRVLTDAVAPWADRITHAPGPLRNDLGVSAVLVRPDGVVAWVAGGAVGFEDAARRWFGDPRTPARRRDLELSGSGRR